MIDSGPVHVNLLVHPYSTSKQLPSVVIFFSSSSRRRQRFFGLRPPWKIFFAEAVVGRFVQTAFDRQFSVQARQFLRQKWPQIFNRLQKRVEIQTKKGLGIIAQWVEMI